MLLIRWPHPTQINTKRSQTTTGSHSIGHSQSGTGSDKTGRKHPDTDTQIKRGQISRSRRSTHIMWSDIDKEALESRNPYSIPDTDHQGADKENPRLVDSCKHGKRHQQADRRTDRYPMNLPMIDQPTGDQPQAIAKLVKGFKEGNQFETLLGVTGSDKTFTMANVIVQLNKPTLILAHNKTLAAQLYGEFK